MRPKNLKTANSDKLAVLSTLWRVRLLQFFYYCSFGAGIPFFSLYYKKILVTPGGSPASYLIGLIFFLQALMGIVATPC